MDARRRKSRSPMVPEAAQISSLASGVCRLRLRRATDVAKMESADPGAAQRRSRTPGGSTARCSGASFSRANILSHFRASVDVHQFGSTPRWLATLENL